MKGRNLRKTLFLATALVVFGASQSAIASEYICYKHIFPTTRNLCFQAFEAGWNDLDVENKVNSCGFIDWPEAIQDCLRDLVYSYGQSPRG